MVLMLKELLYDSELERIFIIYKNNILFYI